MEWRLMNMSLLLLCAIVSIQICRSKACFQGEKTALLDFKAFLILQYATVNPLLPSWVSDSKSDCCYWERVTCDSHSNHVIHLSLENLDQRAGLSWVFCERSRSLNFSHFLPFKQLKNLKLSNGCFDWIMIEDYRTSTLKNLETLDLSHNHFNASIIKPLSALTSLKNLILVWNGMGGPFPIQDLSALQNLELLDLRNNFLTSPYETQDYRNMSKLKNLKTLDLSGNYFDAGIMKPLSAITSLRNLILADGYIGPLPILELSALQNLELLDLSGNLHLSLTETQDDNTWSRLKKLRTLNLAQSGINDLEILKPLAALPALRSLFLNDNSFEGRLDDNVLANLSNLEVLDLGDIFSLSQVIRTLPIQGLCQLRNLRELNLTDNSFTGTLDACLGNLTSLRALDLSDNLLSRSIPSSLIARLPYLEYLSISNNHFEGSFSLSSLANNSVLEALSIGEMDSNKFQVQTENPPWIPSFQLKYLKMPRCEVNILHKRTIPTFLSSQRSLRYIDISHNDLIGRFPDWLLVNNPNLKAVILNDNSFSGPFQLPPNLNRHMDQLQALDISNNKIQGGLPENIGFLLPQLQYLNVSKNEIDYDIPSSIGEMSNLKILDLSYNNFSRKVPKKVLLGCISLEYLMLSNNSLEGEIFPRPVKMQLLTHLMLENNQFSGTLQDGLLSLRSLTVLLISNNKLSGELPGWIGKLPLLAILSVSWNNLNGVIPNELCQSDRLEAINLSHNRFSGSIPSCSSMLLLSWLNLQGNNLSGPISKAFATIPYTDFVDLRDNKFSGSILEININGTEDWKMMLLGGNQLQGHLPNHICRLQNLAFLDLSRNNFTGSIPLCFNNISFWKKNDAVEQSFAAYHNGSNFQFDFIVDSQYPSFSFERHYKWTDGYAIVEEQLTTKGLSFPYKGNILNGMTGIDLSCNQLSGEIPKQIGDLHDVRSLNLSHNCLNGSIPESFHNLQAVESMDLSYNHLSGTIPLQLQELHYLSYFNVSYNNLSGRAPNQGQFGSFDESNYIGNPDLLVNNSNRGIIAPPSPLSAPFNDVEEEESPIDFIAFCWCFGASYVTILLVFVTILWINPYWRRRWFFFIETCLYKCLGRFLKDAFY